MKITKKQEEKFISQLGKKAFDEIMKAPIVKKTIPMYELKYGQLGECDYSGTIIKVAKTYDGFINVEKFSQTFFSTCDIPVELITEPFTITFNEAK